MLPQRIGIVTSPTGAVLRDILRVLAARYANLDVLVYPCRVQGPEAAGEIVRGIRALNRLGGLDVLIVARGGGSLEDLWPFNEEAVARALAASPYPRSRPWATRPTSPSPTSSRTCALPRLRPPPSAWCRRRPTSRRASPRSKAASRPPLRLRLARTRARVEAVTSHRVFAAERGRLRTYAQRVDDLTRRSGHGARPPPRSSRAGVCAAPTSGSRHSAGTGRSGSCGPEWSRPGRASACSLTTRLATRGGPSSAGTRRSSRRSRPWPSSGAATPWCGMLREGAWCARPARSGWATPRRSGSTTVV